MFTLVLVGDTREPRQDLSDMPKIVTVSVQEQLMLVVDYLQSGGNFWDLDEEEVRVARGIELVLAH